MGFKSTDIDYIGLLKYLEENRDIPYSNPELAKTIDEKEALLEVKKKGQHAISIMKQIVELCQSATKLDKCEPMSWLDGSNTKTRNYLWAQMKYSSYAKVPVSVSLFVETKMDTARFRVCLEIKNDNASKADMKVYHSHLDIPLNKVEGLVYVTGSNEWGHPEEISDKQAEISKKVETGEYKKVQVCKIINQKADQTSEYFESEILAAVNAIIPYYEHVIGAKNDGYWPTFTEYDPKMREPLMEAIKSMDEKGAFQDMNNIQKIEFDKNLILYGPPGTGKTHNSAIYAVAICDGVPVESLTDYDAVMKRYNQLKAEHRIAFTTFHQSYGYEEFIEGIKPIVDEKSKDVSYTIEPGVFKRFCEIARCPANMKVDPDAQTCSMRLDDKPYVFVIDEINRGNISKIFGELITLIENTKREGMPEAASAMLLYSRQAFSVPSNVYILGTMNTADRSIALMDTALRRRFQFEEVMSDTNVLIKIGADKINQAGIELNVTAMLETINKRIEYLFDREHTIGHAFFTELKDEPTVEKLASIFKKSVIPLLQEYFYEDYSKIMLVLGDNGKTNDAHKFIVAKEIKPNLIFRGDASDIDIPDYAYEIQDKAFYDIMSYKEITG